jgi:hypothetical protein
MRKEESQFVGVVGENGIHVFDVGKMVWVWTDGEGEEYELE